jgi:DNA-directed RNA polymerase specialized sigma24 family protein
VDRAAELFRNHPDALYRYLVRLSGDPDFAADAAQEAFVRLLDRAPVGPAERAWLFKVGNSLLRPFTADSRLTADSRPRRR